MREVLVFLFIIVLHFQIVLAYLDPGTGANVIGSIWPLILAVASSVVAFFVKYFWKPVVKRIKKIFKITKTEEKKEYEFSSEEKEVF